MKLYTEEQVIQLIWSLVHQFADGEGILENSINSLTPISLPSNEEIQKASFEYDITEGMDFWNYPFEDGAKWVIDKIKNQQ